MKRVRRGNAAARSVEPSTARESSEAEEYAVTLEVHRRPITAHCYRMLGSLQDAEEVAQDTLLRAWQRRGSQVDPAARRAWLFAVATRCCLDVLRKARRRRASATRAGGSEVAGVTWVEPAPDSLFDTDVSGAESPEEGATRRQRIALAFVVALQALSPRQRAAVLLVDVLGWSPGESARLLEVTVTAINSLLQRARRSLAEVEADRAVASSREGDVQLRAFIAAWEQGDVDALASLLASDVRLAMPPEPQVFHGRDAVVSFLTPFVQAAPRALRFVPSSANGLPAVAIYKRADDARCYRAVGISVIEVVELRISTITRYTTPALFPLFGLSLEMAADELVEPPASAP